MATTTNYSWTTPDDTALVKDGASAIRTLGTAIDTTTKNLNPSTTLGDIEYRSSSANVNTRLGIGSSGQVLTVAAGVPSWANGFSNPLTTTGDVIYSSSGTTAARLGIGSSGQVLTVSSGLPAWATPSSAMTLISTTTLAGTTTISSIPTTYNDLQIVIYRTKNSAGNYDLYCYPNNQSLATDFLSNRGTTTMTFVQDDYVRFTGTTAAMANDQTNAWVLTIHNYASATAIKPFTIAGGYYNNGKFVLMTTGVIRDTSAITSLVIGGAGSSNSGTVLLYGVK